MKDQIFRYATEEVLRSTLKSWRRNFGWPISKAKVVASPMGNGHYCITAKSGRQSVPFGEAWRADREGFTYVLFNGETPRWNRTMKGVKEIARSYFPK